MKRRQKITDRGILLHRSQPCISCSSSDAMAIYTDHAWCYSCEEYFSLDKLEELGYPKIHQGVPRSLLGVPRDIVHRFTTATNYDITMDTRGLLGDPRYTRDIEDIEITEATYYGTMDLGVPRYTRGPQEDTKETTLEQCTYQYVPSRGISRETMEAYGVETKVSADGTPAAIAFPYGSIAIVRTLPTKSFVSKGDSSDVRLFGQDLFNRGSAKSITITEGAFDAMSVYEVFGSKYPCVSVRSASTARLDCERAWSYLNSFENIYLLFDSDTPGTNAASEVARLFDVNKVFQVQLSKWKDANDAYVADPEALRKAWYNAKKYHPKGIVSGYKEVEEILKQESAQARATYPFSTLQEMAYGIRLGELVLFTALEKVGKTEVLRAIEYHLLKTTEENVGIIHLEEQEKRSVQGLVGYELNSPVHLPDAGVSTEEQLKAFKALTKKDGRLHFYTHFGSDDPDTILDVIRYLVGVCHCRYIFLDHITMLVTGFEDEDERKKLDYISTRLAMLTRELQFTLFLVSHVNDQGQTRGSRNIAKVADLIIHLDRDIEATDTTSRNTTKLTCRGNRYAGITGPAGTLVFDPKSYTIKEQEPLKETANEFRPLH